MKKIFVYLFIITLITSCMSNNLTFIHAYDENSNISLPIIAFPSKIAKRNNKQKGMFIYRKYTSIDTILFRLPDSLFCVYEIPYYDISYNEICKNDTIMLPFFKPAIYEPIFLDINEECNVTVSHKAEIERLYKILGSHNRYSFELVAEVDNNFSKDTLTCFFDSIEAYMKNRGFVNKIGSRKIQIFQNVNNFNIMILPKFDCN